MCGRYTLTQRDTDRIAERFQTRLEDLLSERVAKLEAEGADPADATKYPPGMARFNVAPSQEVLTVITDRESGERDARLMRWGLIPNWAKDTKIGYKMINARSETVREKPAYRGLIGKHDHRCLIVADGYYEWLRSEDPKQPRQPFRFTVDGGEPFAFAGLYAHNRSTGELIQSCTIMTCEPNEVAARVHNRMPVILSSPEAEQAWLSPELDADGAVELCRPLEAGRMQSAPANPKVNKVGKGIEGPELLVPPADAPAGDASDGAPA